MRQAIIDRLKDRIEALDKELAKTTESIDRLMIMGEKGGVLFALRAVYDTREEI